MHHFETFRRTVGGQRNEPLVTIQRRGLISLNAAAYRALGSPVAVELLYDARRRTVGLRAVDPHAEHSYLLRSATRSASGPFLISATAFVRYYEIDTSAALRRAGYLDEDILCIDLDADCEEPPGSSPRSITSSDDEGGQAGAGDSGA